MDQSCYMMRTSQGQSRQGRHMMRKQNSYVLCLLYAYVKRAFAKDDNNERNSVSRPKEHMYRRDSFMYYVIVRCS